VTKATPDPGDRLARVRGEQHLPAPAEGADRRRHRREIGDLERLGPDRPLRVDHLDLGGREAPDFVLAWPLAVVDSAALAATGEQQEREGGRGAHQ
jgi:hypothetical protein